ncbi:MAG: alpha/beta hydrolase [Planctomycetaceae bacterium]|jgi:acetyl esterase/lipase|nr:alpha/beta hydrolase [Planctomycetaceae bacterium]
MKRLTTLLFVTFISLILTHTATLTAKEPVTFKNIPYVSGGGVRQQLDIMLPDDYKDRTEKLPLVVWIHGGGWTAGSKDNSPNLILVNQGFATASINYRYATEKPFPAQLEDCKSAIRWLRAHANEYNFDTEKVGVWGASAGGHLVALLGTTGDTKKYDVGENLDQSSVVQAICDIYGPTDFVITTKNWGEFHVVREPVLSLLGGKDASVEIAKGASPLYHVKKNMPPFLILHGDQDKLVNLDQSVRFEKALKDVNVEVELLVAKDAGHDGFFVTRPDFIKKTVDFFTNHLKRNAKQPDVAVMVSGDHNKADTLSQPLLETTKKNSRLKNPRRSKTNKVTVPTRYTPQHR